MIKLKNTTICYRKLLNIENYNTMPLSRYLVLLEATSPLLSIRHYYHEIILATARLFDDYENNDTKEIIKKQKGGSLWL